MTLATRKPLKAISGRPRKCAVRTCRAMFVPTQSFQSWCSPECGVQIARDKQQKERTALAKIERKAIKARKEQLKGRAEYMKEAQQAFNAWVRERDADQPCISCGRHHQGQWHAGHYRTTKAAPELRFEPLNVWKQCAPCNNHKSGDIVNYRINLVEKIGAEKVAWLEGPHEPKKYSIADLKAITAMYRALLRDLKKQQAGLMPEQGAAAGYQGNNRKGAGGAHFTVD